MMNVRPALFSAFSAALLVGCTSGTPGSDDTHADASDEGSANESGEEESDGSSGDDQVPGSDASTSSGGTTTSSSEGSTSSGTATSTDTSDATSSSTDTTTTDAETDDTDSGDSMPDPPTGVCPPGPYAASPFEGVASMTATAIQPSGELPLELPNAGLVEGPVWLGDSLVFSHFQFDEVYTSEVLRFTPPDRFEVAFAPNAGVNGMALRPDGTLLGASHLVGGIVTLDLDTDTATPVVAEYMGARLNSPNDLVVRADGNIYFSDPLYQAPNPRPQGEVQRLFRITPDGTLLAVTERSPSAQEGPDQPNGVALSPDGNTLYLGHGQGVLAYALADDGEVMLPGEPLGGIGSTGSPGVDGMAVDCAGNVYAAHHSPGVVSVISPEGAPLGTITVATSLTNLAFGGPQRTTLYATAGDPQAGTPLYQIELAIPGLPY